jgi:hypothetical protein
MIADRFEFACSLGQKKLGSRHSVSQGSTLR